MVSVNKGISMSNYINTNYAIKETGETVNSVKQNYNASFRPQFKASQASDTFETQDKQQRKGLLIAILSTAAVVTAFCGALAHKGGKTLGKDAALGEKIEQGWRELRGKEKDVNKKTEASASESKNNTEEAKKKAEENAKRKKETEEISETIVPPTDEDRAKAAEWLKKNRFDPNLAYEKDISLSYLKMFSDDYKVESQLTDILLENGYDLEKLKTLDWEKKIINKDKGLYKYFLKDKNNKPVYSIDVTVSDWKYSSDNSADAKKRWRTLSNMNFTDFSDNSKTKLETSHRMNVYDKLFKPGEAEK